MEQIENFAALPAELYLPSDSGLPYAGEQVLRVMRVNQYEVAALALRELWRDLDLADEPLMFVSPSYGRMQAEHHPLFLDQLVARGKRQKKQRFGMLASWRSIAAPRYAHSIAAADNLVTLHAPDMLRFAQAGERHTLPGPQYGWKLYTFASGWNALSVRFQSNDGEESHNLVLVVLPPGRQDEWLAFLRLVGDLHNAALRRGRRGKIEIIGGIQNMVDVIKKASFNDLVLPDETLERVTAQRRIFDPVMLRRYAALGVPRFRKALLIGPPGTGKTTLLKAEGAFHAKKGGVVFYVCAPARNRGTTSWQHLSNALRNAAESRLPALVLVEDFELFVSDPFEMQQVLNTLDGAATPDNPAGTLMLATSNDPEKIDARIRDRPGRIDVLIEIGLVEDEALALRFLRHFLGAAYRDEHAAIAPLLLKQPGSHFREVCIAGSMRALDMNHSDVLYEDLLWAHEAILNGRALVEQSGRFSPAPARKRGGFFGKDRV